MKLTDRPGNCPGLRRCGSKTPTPQTNEQAPRRKSGATARDGPQALRSQCLYRSSPQPCPARACQSLSLRLRGRPGQKRKGAVVASCCQGEARRCRATRQELSRFTRDFRAAAQVTGLAQLNDLTREAGRAQACARSPCRSSSAARGLRRTTRFSPPSIRLARGLVFQAACLPQAVKTVLRQAARLGTLPEHHREEVAEYLRGAEQTGATGLLPAPWSQQSAALSVAKRGQARQRGALSDSESDAESDAAASGVYDFSDDDGYADPSPALAAAIPELR